MPASRFSEAQIAFVLRQAEDGTSVGEVCRKAGISEATFYNWRKKCAGLMPSAFVNNAVWLLCANGPFRATQLEGDWSQAPCSA